MKATGKLDWAISGGNIPFHYNGNAPQMMSHDKIAVLNTTEEKAVVSLYIFYEDQTPVGTYEVEVLSRRLKKIRFNDLIDPEAMQLGRNYSCYIKSNVKIVVQFSRMNTGAKNNAEMTTMAYPVDD